MLFNTQRRRDELSAAFFLLVDADEFSSDLGVNPCEFAVGMDELQLKSVSTSLMRWLHGRGFVESDSTTKSLSVADGKINDTVCFTITARGRQFARQWLTENMTAHTLLDGTVDTSTDGSGCPKWCSERRSLTVDGIMVKSYAARAPNQETVLAVFEEEGWPPRISDPLSPLPDSDPKRRLNDTVRALNRHQKYKAIQFRCDGTGEGINWTYRSIEAVSISNTA